MGKYIYLCTQNHRIMAELRIKEILKEKGVTAKSLAESMGKAPQYLNNIINGGKGASLNTLQEIADALHVPMASLFADYKKAEGSVVTCPKCGETFAVEIKLVSKDSEKVNESE